MVVHMPQMQKKGAGISSWLGWCTVLVVLGAVSGRADEFTDYQKAQNRELEAFQKKQTREIKKQKQEFLRYLAESRAEFNSWEAQRKRELAAFEKEIKSIWGKYIAPTNKRWVEYSRDKRSVCAVDFEKNSAVVAVVVDADATKEQITRKITGAVTRALTSRGSGRSKPVAVDRSEQLLAKPVLHEQVVDMSGAVITVDRVSEFAKGLAGTAKRTPVKPVEPGKTPSAVKIELSLRLAPDNLRKRIRQFLPAIEKFCAKYDINKARVLATIHTESHFNPMAVSSANAIGLMQLVPIYGGAEAYEFVYGPGSIPYEGYLYDPEKNIELGCAYIYLLKNRYFISVKDSVSRRFCTIAGYNTGPRNVAYAFTGARKVHKSIPAINCMKSAQEVYDYLIIHLPCAETRHYLAEVTERMKLYEQ